MALDEASGRAGFVEDAMQGVIRHVPQATGHAHDIGLHISTDTHGHAHR